jgi:16S rRNA (adenine1518-N6/adenine1519-N6)-dimethyltransferase
VTSSVRALLRAHDLQPRKNLGQNFLVDPAALDRIITAADLSPDDVVVEVGAGLGTLTRPLAKAAGRVLAVELDDHLVEILHTQLVDLPNVEIVHGDILRISHFDLPHLAFKVVANLPYYITSAVIRRFLAEKPRPNVLVLTLQREVAQRIVAQPGQMSLLAISVQLYGKPQIVAQISRGAFYPQPNVDSAVVRVDVGEQLEAELAAGLEEALLFRVARAGFAQKRKTLRNSLSAGLALPQDRVEETLGEMGLDSRRRAQTLSLQEWADVTLALSSLLV